MLSNINIQFQGYFVIYFILLPWRNSFWNNSMEFFHQRIFPEKLPRIFPRNKCWLDPRNSPWHVILINMVILRDGIGGSSIMTPVSTGLGHLPNCRSKWPMRTIFRGILVSLCFTWSQLIWGVSRPFQLPSSITCIMLLKEDAGCLCWCCSDQ